VDSHRLRHNHGVTSRSIRSSFTARLPRPVVISPPPCAPNAMSTFQSATLPHHLQTISTAADSYTHGLPFRAAPLTDNFHCMIEYRAPRDLGMARHRTHRNILLLGISHACLRRYSQALHDVRPLDSMPVTSAPRSHRLTNDTPRNERSSPRKALFSSANS
jgi:hypothetical protein